MKKCHWEMLGFITLGIMVFICAIIVIRWAVDFVTWSALDSAWVQALGSVAAIIGALEIFRRQNAAVVRNAEVQRIQGFEVQWNGKPG
jgi:hypothetical protein